LKSVLIGTVYCFTQDKVLPVLAANQSGLFTSLNILCFAAQVETFSANL